MAKRKHNQRGHLDFKATATDGTVIEHEGDYRFVGEVDGMLAFAPATDDPVIYLHEEEIVSFGRQSRDRGQGWFEVPV